MKQEIKVTTIAGNSILTVLEGKAPAQPDPKPYEFAGDITAPGQYLSKAKALGHHDGQPAVVQVNYGNFAPTPSRGLVAPSLTLIINHGTSITTKIVGQLRLNPDLERLQVNTGARFTQQQLRQAVRLCRANFADLSQYDALLTGIEKLSVTATSTLKNEQDQRGNRAAAFSKQVQSSLIQSFLVMLRPFTNSRLHKDVQIDLCFDHSDSGLSFWLESLELPAILSKEAETIIDHEIGEHLAELPLLVEV